jgi:hypothetical protein
VAVVGINFLLRKRIVLGTSIPPATTTKTKKKQNNSHQSHFPFSDLGMEKHVKPKLQKFIVA